jgi:F0F1-type ATP synthase membrane subunit b/b'
LEEEAKRTAAVELEKAKAELRHELLREALSKSSDSLGRSLDSNEQKKLQNEFAEKIQVVSG